MILFKKLPLNISPEVDLEPTLFCRCLQLISGVICILFNEFDKFLLLGGAHHSQDSEQDKE